MRWITFLVLWVVAIVVAVLILRRVRRGKTAVLTGRWSPRLVRMIVVVLVVLGVGEEVRPPDAGAAPAKLPIRSSDDELPKSITPDKVQMWMAINEQGGRYGLNERTVFRALAADRLTGVEAESAIAQAKYLPPSIRALIQADLMTKVAEKPAKRVSVGDLRAALDDLEKAGRFDHYWNAYLWRKTATAESPDDDARIQLYDRFRQHARITDALIRAHADVKPLMQPPRAWASKAGPRPGEMAAMKAHAASLNDLIKVAAEALPTTDEGTWKRDGIVQIKPVAGSPAPTLIRGGRTRDLPANESTRFGRLDLLRTGDKPAVIQHDWLGKIELPPNKLISVWDLPNLLPDTAKQKIDQAVVDALRNNSEDAADQLERCLAISHQAIRIGLKELPHTKGRPRMRLILALFDDTVMPSLPIYRVGDEASRFDTGRGAGNR
jgi:hypothetical protein